MISRRILAGVYLLAIACGPEAAPVTGESTGGSTTSDDVQVGTSGNDAAANDSGQMSDEDVKSQSDDTASRANEDVAENTDTGAEASDNGTVESEPDAGPVEPRTKKEGCEGQEFLLPVGFVDMRIEPQSYVAEVMKDEQASVEFKVIGTLAGGAEKEMDDAIFVVSTTEMGQLGGNGKFESFKGRGGVMAIKALISGGCVETQATVTTVFHATVGDNPPDPEWFDGQAEPQVNPASPVLAYPLDGAAWPKNLPPMVAQWTYDFGGPSTVFRLDFEAPYARVYVYGRYDDFKHKDKKYVAEVPPEAWLSITNMVGGSPHKVRVVAATEVGNGIADGLVASAPANVHFTQDLFGGAVYYWNTAKSGIRVLDLATKVPKVDSVPIAGGCHGCHATSPDGTTIAVSFLSKWTLKVHNVEDGKPASWVHPNATAFLNGGYTMYPAFSKAWWNEQNKQMILVKMGNTVGGTKPSHIYSLDLLSGKSTAMTNTTQGLSAAQMFPAFSGDGSKVVFTSGDKSKSISLTDNSQLWIMDYNGGDGGKPEPLTGADKKELLQYYPSFTPDDLYVVFNRASNDTSKCNAGGKAGGPGSGGSYDNCTADLWVVPTGGGDAIRLDNASGQLGANYANSWPSMSDKVTGQYYWVAFSTRRPYGVLEPTSKVSSKGHKPQLWVAAIDPAKIASGKDPSFAPIWLPGQDFDGGNHIGQWSVRN